MSMTIWMELHLPPEGGAEGVLLRKGETRNMAYASVWTEFFAAGREEEWTRAGR